MGRARHGVQGGERAEGRAGNRSDTRVAPAQPTLFFTLVSFGGHTCAEWSSQIGAADPTSKPVKSPAYLPTGWDPATIVSPTEGRPGNITAGFCLDSLTGVVIGSMEYKGSLNDADLKAVTPVLVSIAKAAGVDSHAVAACAPPPPPPRRLRLRLRRLPPPPPPPSPVPTPHAAAAVIPPIPPPPPPPPPSHDEPEEHDELHDTLAQDLEDLRFELALAMLSPGTARPKASSPRSGSTIEKS